VGTIFYDGFEGSALNTDLWLAYDRIGDEANSELQCMVSANISVSGSMFTGVAVHEDHVCGDTDTSPVTQHYTSFQAASRMLFQYPAGGSLVFTARAKMPGGVGNWPLIWMLSAAWQPSQPFNANTSASTGPDATWAEIDWVEYLFDNRTGVNCVIHAALNEGSDVKSLAVDASAQFIVYRLDWSAGQLIWSVDYEDGTGFHILKTLTNAGVPSTPMYLILSNAIGGIGTNTPNPATFPQTYLLDWIQVVQVGGNVKPKIGSPVVSGGPVSSARIL